MMRINGTKADSLKIPMKFINPSQISQEKKKEDTNHQYWGKKEETLLSVLKIQ